MGRPWFSLRDSAIHAAGLYLFELLALNFPFFYSTFATRPVVTPQIPDIHPLYRYESSRFYLFRLTPSILFSIHFAAFHRKFIVVYYLYSALIYFVRMYDIYIPALCFTMYGTSHESNNG